MVLIYYKDNGEIKNFYTGNTSQIGWYYSQNPEWIYKIGEVILEDSNEIFQNPYKYRVVTDINGNAIVIPKIHIKLKKENNKLLIELQNLYETDKIDKIPILISGKRLELEPGEYEIELNSNKPVEIHVDSNQFTYEPLIWEVD